MEKQEITVTPVWVLYRGKIIISNEMFVISGTILPFDQENIAVIAGATGDRHFPSDALTDPKLTVQGEKLPEDLLLATPNLRKHLQVLKETNKLRFMFRVGGSLSVSIEEPWRLVD